MTTPTITVDTMRDKLYTLDMVRNRLATTEPLATHAFRTGGDIRFQYREGWNDTLDEKGETDLVDAYVTVGSVAHGTEFQMTKESALDIASKTGLSKAYVKRSPHFLTDQAVNYWYANGLPGGTDFQLLTTGTTAAALTKSTLTPFSNLEILDAVLAGIEEHYGVGEVLADYKFHHSLTDTTMRLIVPEARRNLLDTGTENDTWSTGLQIHNSIVGDRQTEIDGYLFRWWCTNGSTNTHNAGVWSRKSQGQDPASVYAWAQRSVDEILGGLEGALDEVQATAYVNLAGDFNAMAQDVFDRYKIPTAQRTLIMQRLADEGIFTMYSLMQAITVVANDATMKREHVEKLLRVGGDLPHVHGARCNLGSLHVQPGAPESSDID